MGWSLKVGNDYLVSDGLNKYSIPYDLIGEKVNLRLTPHTVEVFFRGSRVAVHARSNVEGLTSGPHLSFAATGNYRFPTVYIKAEIHRPPSTVP